MSANPATESEFRSFFEGGRRGAGLASSHEEEAFASLAVKTLVLNYSGAAGVVDTLIHSPRVRERGGERKNESEKPERIGRRRVLAAVAADFRVTLLGKLARAWKKLVTKLKGGKKRETAERKEPGPPAVTTF